MSCFYCIYYNGLQCKCSMGRFVLTGSESFDCNGYVLNEEENILYGKVVK